MADLPFSHLYPLISNEDGTFSQGGAIPYSGVATDGDSSSSTFDPNETITVKLNGGSTFQTTYYGNYHGDLVATQGGQQLAIGDQAPGENFTPDQHAFAVCFMAGTLISTPTGEAAIEMLAPGDLVLATDGSARPIKWMWRQTMMTMFADELRGLPVTVKAGALGDALPVRDLHVSPDHALLIDGLLVHAGALVNGTSVVRKTGLPERFTYYHIELEDHALVMVEGVPAETFVDAVTRRRFDNWAEYEARFGDAPAMAPLDLPRVKSRRALPAALRRRLDAVEVSWLPVAA